MTSAMRGEGGLKIPQFCGQTVHTIRTKGGMGLKNPKIFRTSYMEAPYVDLCYFNFSYSKKSDVSKNPKISQILAPKTALLFFREVTD